MDINWTDILIILGSLLVCTIAYVKWLFNYWERRNVPYLQPSFPMGTFELPWAMKKGFNKIMADSYTEFKAKGYKHGGIFLFLSAQYVPVDLDLVKSILIKDFQHFVSRGVYYNEESDPLSAHLFTIEGEKWRHLRTRLSPTFTSGKMKAMFQLVLDCGDGLEKEVNKLWMKREPVDIKEMGALFTTNVIGTCAFGLDCNCFENPNNDFRHYTKKFFQGGLAFILKVTAAQAFPNLCKKLGVAVIPGDVSKFFMTELKNIIDYRKSHKIIRNDFLDLLLEVKKGAKTEEDSFTFEEIAAQAFVFFLAGFETSSSTMTFAFYEMAKHQEIQDKVREEIHRVMTNHGNKLTYDAIMEMTYMSQVFDETLRKYPIVPVLTRICTKDYKIPGEDLVIKKGVKVQIPLQGIHYDPEYYPDPEKFEPERFSPENKANRHPCVYMPFGEGPRICIGMRFGIMQAKIGMATMLKNYKYTLNSKTPEMKMYSKSILLRPLGDVLLDIEKVY